MDGWHVTGELKGLLTTTVRTRAGQSDAPGGGGRWRTAREEESEWMTEHSPRAGVRQPGGRRRVRRSGTGGGVSVKAGVVGDKR